MGGRVVVLDRSLAGEEGVLEVVVAGGGVEVVLIAGDSSSEHLLPWVRALLVAAASFFLRSRCNSPAVSP